MRQFFQWLMNAPPFGWNEKRNENVLQAIRQQQWQQKLDITNERQRQNRLINYNYNLWHTKNKWLDADTTTTEANLLPISAPGEAHERPSPNGWNATWKPCSLVLFLIMTFKQGEWLIAAVTVYVFWLTDVENGTTEKLKLMTCLNTMPSTNTQSSERTPCS